jgi:hypothetical protein
MKLNEYDQKMLNDFFEATDFLSAGYKHTTFSYFAVKDGDDFKLSQGKLLLQGTPFPIASGHFQSANIRAGIYRLDELNLTVKKFFEDLPSGVIKTPHGDLHFPPEKDRPYSIHFNPFYSDPTSLQQRQMQLYFRGDRRYHSNDSIKLDWELRAASVPFDSLQDLFNEYAIGQIGGDFRSVEVMALNIAAIGNESLVRGATTHLAIHLANGLDQNKASLGYRIIEKNKVVRRGTVAGANLTWTNTDVFQKGEIDMEVPSGSILHCIANYDGQAQHFYWVIDPSTAPNPLRAAYQIFDNKLEGLTELMTKQYGKGSKSREFEIGIARLLFLLGFSPIHLGDMQDTPDVMATTPSGNFAVIECTTGLLKADNKLSLLVERTEKVRQSLMLSGHGQLKVLPVIITTKTREEVKADLDQAQKLGVLVITRESFTNAINRSLIFPDANKIYLDAENALKPPEAQLNILGN